MEGLQHWQSLLSLLFLPGNCGAKKHFGHGIDIGLLEAKCRRSHINSNIFQHKNQANVLLPLVGKKAP